jgi:hypothetical protein
MIRSRLPPLALAYLAVGLLACVSGCASKDNPVLPPSGPTRPGGQLGGSAALDASLGPDTAVAVSDAAAASETSTAACDLLKQDCPSRSNGCYPVSATGLGRCMPAGTTGALGTCVLGEDPQACAPGLVCIALTTGIALGQCLYLCDVSNAAMTCGASSLCQPLPSFPKTSTVGYCLPA